MKFQVSYSRKVCTPNQYENMSIGIQIEQTADVMSIEEVYKRCVDFVEDKIAQRLLVLERETR